MGGGVLMHVCVKGQCKPGECPAIWTGPPTQAMIRAIQSVTRGSSDGRLYFRRSIHDGWRRLRASDYPELNRILDNFRSGLTYLCERV